MFSGWRRLWLTTETFGRDSLQLASAMIRSVPRSSIRDVIVQYARRSNTAAVSLMNVDREVGLLRYWGLSGYLRHKKIGGNWELTRRWLNQSSVMEPATTINRSNDESKLTTTKPKGPTARVAFMVTAAMRQELTERLELSEDQIKRLTPLQASLILQNNVPAHEVSSKLPELEHQHFEMQQAANQSAAAAAMAQPGELNDDPSLASEQDADDEESKREEDKINTDTDSSTISQQEEPLLVASGTESLASGITSADNDDVQPSIDEVPVEKRSVAFIDSIDDWDAARASPEKIWFQLVQHDSTERESAVVGLYRDVNEAQLALETRELFERRRSEDKKKPMTTSFVITRVLRY